MKKLTNIKSQNPNDAKSNASEEKVTALKYKRIKPKKTISSELRGLFNVDEIKNNVKFWKQFLSYFKGQPVIKNEENAFFIICGMCLVKPKEQKLLLKFRSCGLRGLNHYLEFTNRREFQSIELKLLTWATLSLMSFYYTKSAIDATDCSCLNKHKYSQAKTLFRSAMYLIPSDKQIEVVKHCIQYITITGQWNSEDYDTCIFQELLTVVTKPELLVAKIIKQIETSQKENEIEEALNVTCTLATILEHSYWDKYLFNNVLHNCLNTLLKVYLICGLYKDSFFNLENVKFRMVIKTCIKNFIYNIKDNKGLVTVLESQAKCLKDKSIPREDKLEIMEMIAFTAQQHHTKFLRESLPPKLLDLILTCMEDNDRGLMITAHKIFQYLLDRHKNLKYFTEPIYYFKGRSDFVINSDFSSEDVHFFKSFSKNFFKGINHCMVTFSDKYGLITCYVTLCLILVEIPEPVITINVIHVLITVQNNILNSDEDQTTVTKAHTHAIIACLLSLICVIHQNDVTSLKKYVEEVVRFRNENSPHLLPPLQNRYDISNHYRTTYYSQLYFQEEEILYALQKCWLGKRQSSQ